MADLKDSPASPFSEDALRSIAREKVILRMGLNIHVLAYIGVNILLACINLFVPGGGAPFLWFVIVASGWLAGLGMHWTAYMVYVKGVIGSDKKGLLFHSAAGVFAIQALVIINLLADASLPWFLWPVGAIIVSIIVHLIVYLRFVRGKETGVVKDSWMDRQIESELSRAKSKEGGV